MSEEKFSDYLLVIHMQKLQWLLQDNTLENTYHEFNHILKGFTDLTFSELDYDKLTDKCDWSIYCSTTWNRS